jgi:cephalosporin hydroxylase
VGDSFYKKNKISVNKMGFDKSLWALTKKWILKTHSYEYNYHFSWLGRPIIQYPQDIIAFQEIIWKTKPDLVIETGIARGGSLIFLSSMLELNKHGIVLGIDNSLRSHNEISIKKHPLQKRLKILKGSSIEPKIIQSVFKIAKNKQKIFLILDSDHSKKHVLEELMAYSPLISKGCYVVVCDTILDNFPKNWLQNHGIDRPWNKQNNPKTAVHEFLKLNNRFIIDKDFQNKLLITTAPDGYLKCIRD